MRTETFTGADKMFAKLSQAPDAYDVVVIDPEYIEKLDNAGLLSSLDAKAFDFSDYIEPLKEFPLCWRNGKLKAVLVRYGINALVYNTEKLTREEVSSYDILFNPKVTGKVGIWDWYLPNMGILSLYNGFSPPYQLSTEQFGKVETSLQNLRPQVKAIMGSFSDINAALAREEVWVVPAHGEHTAAVLAEQGNPISWTVPKEGGIMWIETLGIPPKAKNRDEAIQYIHYMQRPETMAKLTWRKAYRSNTPSKKAITLLSSRQQDLFKVHDANEAVRLVQSVSVRMLPSNASGASAEKTWQSAWQKFKANE
uniref:Spermidine/putrescine transport system substrate-binding protein n=1 Tax=Candidatus Kentrum sp. LPFa TaxID=2126335 RepID=A0A450WNU2_9GAMM|nr:MAG: spermidine/putrescine transport system substrate-binding protein [Candidatus Kentron sp. LPFa]VFK33025.1 MAG: spermidine/putrescine transport system substrate-binding protein [Candidatus Kentron sp. LPFa]